MTIDPDPGIEALAAKKFAELRNPAALCSLIETHAEDYCEDVNFAPFIRAWQLDKERLRVVERLRRAYRPDNIRAIAETFNAKAVWHRTLMRLAADLDALAKEETAKDDENSQD